MTPANQTKLAKIAKGLQEASDSNCNANTTMFVILDTIRELTWIATDLHFRPEANK